MSKDYKITPTGGRPAFEFTGEQIARVSSHRKGVHKWSEIEAYKTAGGSWVIVKIGAVDPSVADRFETWVDVMVFKENETAAIVERLGYGRLVEELYEKMGITSIKID